MTTALAIFGYNRPDHLRKCLEAVSRNELIDTYIFLDGGYTRETYNAADNFFYLVSVEKQVLGLHACSEHLGCAKNIYRGIDMILTNYDSIIVVEDDIIVADNFIEYMLKGLGVYKDKQDVGSLTGYTLIKNKEIYASKRGCAWGWATWKDRWESFNRNIEPLDNWGDDILPILDRALKGTVDTWDAQFSLYHLVNNLKCIHPPESLVKNIGTDGSGTHQKKGLSKFDTDINNVEPLFKYPVEIDEGIRKQFCKINDLSLIRKTINFLKTLIK